MVTTSWLVFQKTMTIRYLQWSQQVSSEPSWYEIKSLLNNISCSYKKQNTVVPDEVQFLFAKAQFTSCDFVSPVCYPAQRDLNLLKCQGTRNIALLYQGSVPYILKGRAAEYRSLYQGLCYVEIC